MSKTNPILTRVDTLAEQYAAFARTPGARLLVWRADSDEIRIIEALAAREASTAGELPDYFLVFNEPFEDGASHGRRLVASLKSRVDEARAADANRVNTTWECPPAAGGESDLDYFLRVCGHFRSHHAEMMNDLAVALLPKQADKAWADWLAKLLKAKGPERVRFVTADRTDDPRITDIATLGPGAVEVPAALDMPAAYVELARSAPGGGPGHAFRVHFVDMTVASGAGKLDELKASATKALAIAKEQGWADMQAVVHMTLGSAMLGRRDTDAAIAAFRSAGAAVAAQPDAPASGKVLVQSRFAEGAALVSAGRFPEAADLYEKTAPLALKAQDGLMTMESLRMAAYCKEQAKDHESAWRLGQSALDAAEKLDETLRKNSTVKFIEEGLLRIAGDDEGERARAVRQRVAKIMGESTAPSGVRAGGEGRRS